MGAMGNLSALELSVEQNTYTLLSCRGESGEYIVVLQKHHRYRQGKCHRYCLSVGLLRTSGCVLIFGHTASRFIQAVLPFPRGER